MKKILILAAFSMAFTANARIGYTPEQCTERYGEPVNSLSADSENLQRHYYSVDGIEIETSFFEGVCKRITYTTQAVKLTDKEIKLLIRKNIDAIWKGLKQKNEIKNGIRVNTHIWHSNLGKYTRIKSGDDYIKLTIEHVDLLRYLQNKKDYKNKALIDKL